MGTLKIFDTVNFSLLDSNLIKVKDDYAGAFKPQVPGQMHPSGMGMLPGQNPALATTNTPATQAGLLVRIAATHSGLITRNNGFYLPDRMKKGASSFTDNYPKPVLLHHNDHSDNIGRIIQSTYRDTSGSIVDKYNGFVVKDRKGNEKGTLSDRMLRDFSAGNMPFGMMIDVVTSLLRDSILDDTSYDGLGYIELVANITDPEAIQKLLDGRYLTGSVGATTNAAICSICKSDWTDSGQCEHRPGGIYDGAKCFVIAGDLTYDEYSFVNVPADRHSKVLELHYNGIQDSVKIEKQFSGIAHETKLGFPQYELPIKEESSMKIENAKKDEGVKVQDSTVTSSEPPVKVEEVAPVTPATDAPVADSKTEETKVEETVTTTENKTEDSKVEEPKVEEVKAEDVKTETHIAPTETSAEDKTLLDKVSSLEKTIEELKERLEAQRKEYTALSKDFDSLQDSIVKAKLDTRKVKESHLKTLQLLRDHKIEAQDLSTLEDSTLDLEIEQTTKAVDMVKIVDKLGDGMSRIPVGEVHSPVDVTDTTEEPKNSLDVAVASQIYEHYMTLRMSRGQTAAEAFLVDMRKKGKLPQE